MFKWIVTVIACIFLILSENVWAHQDQWESLGAKLSLYNIIHDQEGKIVSASTLLSENGITQFIMYLQTKKDLYRCVEVKDISFTTRGFSCERLIKAEPEIPCTPHKTISKN